MGIDSFAGRLSTLPIKEDVPRGWEDVLTVL
jgi:hypothetical protein